MKSVVSLLLVTLAACSSRAEELTRPAPNAKPLLVMLEISPWYLGSSMPIFALYDDGTVIFTREADKAFHPNYKTTKINQAEIRSLLADVEKLGVRSDYVFPPVATDSGFTEIHWWVGSQHKKIEIRGSNKKTWGEDVLMLVNRLRSYKATNAVSWLPAQIEFVLQRHDSRVCAEWPKDWPPLNSKTIPFNPRTGRRHLYCNSDKWSELLKMQDAEGEPFFTLQNGDEEWGAEARFHFPGENAWLEENDEDLGAAVIGEKR